MQAQISMKGVMLRGHSVAKEMVGHYVARLSLGLRQAWKEAKQIKEVQKEMETLKVNEDGRLLMGYDVYMNRTDEEKQEIKDHFKYESGRGWYLNSVEAFDHFDIEIKFDTIGMKQIRLKTKEAQGKIVNQFLKRIPRKGYKLQESVKERFHEELERVAKSYLK